MRDPNRIPVIIKRLLDLWNKYPELRLGQLIGNCYHYPSGIDPYFDEDDELMTNLEEYYENS